VLSPQEEEGMQVGSQQGLQSKGLELRNMVMNSPG
jgi:hypothetical protein